ncbi:alpha/beta fold hydrolase [Streptomyces scopuliridis]|uniref:Alpha/beta fold hydrolase n=1 Tax=Streptomyces scopuliridis TaxID=452529 RepID=A0ACD4ZBY8_9ACTN|nr:alpha/beta fold hydrolase [Streptomyces scopuliridis]WSB31526.1 alpha/beta fold hydrolase [Streptomyces scopuliridis]WSB95772.1 alpha/beta fold hydrolase [Streptomyces scopuliridis]WSC10521.1 alpha/beta fold hydrolase [Streptomyces scopuliridis]
MKDTTVVRPRRDPSATKRFICLGFCGGGAGSYVKWADAMPPGVEFAAICYPGREGRFVDDFAGDWDELVDDTLDAVVSAADIPYVLFGHSMGGWVAFDIAAQIEERGGPAPEALVVSSANAPSRGLTVADMFPSQQDSDEQLIAWLQKFGLMSEHLLNDPDLREMAVELMRADIRVRDSFHYREGAVVSTAMHVLTGDGDEVIDPNSKEQWRKLARGEFQHTALPGGHFYTPEIWDTLPSHITSINERVAP